MNNFLDNKNIMITGGTGSFGRSFTRYLLEKFKPNKIIIYSRDEYKQFQMAEEFGEYNSDILRFFIGDVRDEERLKIAMNKVDYVVHAAALKRLSVCEYNPLEAIKTNIIGAISVINAAMTCDVDKVISLSTDKAVGPINLYGGTKFVSDKLFIASNAYSGGRRTSFSTVRYGNVMGSRGSVIQKFKKIIAEGGTALPITDYRMSRFWIDINEGIRIVLQAIEESRGGETYVVKSPSFKIVDLAEAMMPNCEKREVGVREAEKISEVLISSTDSSRTYEYKNNYIIYPESRWWNEETIIDGGLAVEPEFEYSSATNTEWLGVEDIRKRLENEGLN